MQLSPHLPPRCVSNRFKIQLLQGEVCCGGRYVGFTWVLNEG